MLLAMRRVSHPEVDESVDAYYYPAEALSAWLQANPPPAGYDAEGTWLLNDKEPSKLDASNISTWLYSKAGASAKALWLWAGVAEHLHHFPLRAEMCVDWLREHPLPDFSADIEEPLVVPLPCFETCEAAKHGIVLLEMTQELWSEKLRSCPMFTWGVVRSAPQNTTVASADNDVFQDLMSKPKAPGDASGVLGAEGNAGSSSSSSGGPGSTATVPVTRRRGAAAGSSAAMDPART